MSAKLDFFIPVTYTHEDTTFIQSLRATVDNYFYFGGKKAHIIKIEETYEEAVLIKTKTSTCMKICKLMSYFTLVIPLIILTAKAILRSTHNIRLLQTEPKIEAPDKIPLIRVDLHSLNLDPSEKGVFYSADGSENIMTLRDGIEEIVTELNRQISVGLTNLELNLGEHAFEKYIFLKKRDSLDSELWLDRILKALHDQGHLLNWDSDFCTYHIEV